MIGEGPSWHELAPFRVFSVFSGQMPFLGFRPSDFDPRPSVFKATPVPISLTPRFSGVWCARAMAGNRFNGFLACVAGTGHLMSLSIADQDGPSWWSVTSTVGKRIETVETVSMASAPNVTPLKRGVNERFAEPGV